MTICFLQKTLVNAAEEYNSRFLKTLRLNEHPDPDQYCDELTWVLELYKWIFIVPITTNLNDESCVSRGEIKLSVKL